MLVSAIVDEIVNEVGGDTSDTEFVAKVFGFYKAGLRRIPAFIRDRLFIVEGSLTLSYGAITLDLSTLSPAFVKERAVWYLGTSNKRIPIIQAQSHEDFNIYYTPNSYGNPVYYKIYGRTMRFNVKAASALTIGLDYSKEISNVLTSDTFFGTEPMVEVSKEMCKRIYYKDYEEDRAKANDAALDCAALMNELEADYEAQEMGGHVTEIE